jgi:hypothetical protein
MRLRFMLSAVAVLLFVHPVLSGCLQYEPVCVELRGVIARETFPGRPNYESIQDGDEPEACWILTLERPVCVDGTPGDDTDVTEKGVQEIQLVLSKDQYAAYASLPGKKVSTSGTLFHAITGHHHKSVLMTVREIKALA